MALTLQEIRAKLLEQQAKKERGGRAGGQDNANYPFWNNAEGSTAVIRFLEDGNKSNDFFWVERLIIKLPFPGIKGQMSRPTEVQVPCMDMWQPNSCPVNAEIRPWWKMGKEYEDMARKYWRKKSFLFQGFVVQNPNAEDAANAPENPIRRFVINPSVFDRIKTVFLDQEVENNPIDHDNGLDFRLVKGSKGGYADYGTSSWARRERALSAEERSAVSTYGLYNLSDFLPKKPDDAHLRIIMEMFQDSVDEKPYDPDKYAQFYKPYGLQTSAPASSDIDADMKAAEQKFVTAAPVATRNVSITPPKAVNTDDAPFDGGQPIQQAAPASEPKKISNPEDILAALRRRQQGNG